MPKQDQNTQQRKATPIVLSIFSSKLLLRKLPILMPAVAMCGFLALISVFFASADSASDTYAVDSGNQITTEVDGQYYVTLTTSDVNFSVAPSKNENAAKQRVDVGVETNVAGGAKLYLAMGSNSNSLHLNGNTAQSSPVIAAVADGTGVNNFAMNTWGYSTDDQTYSAVPTAASDPALLATVDGKTVGSTSGSVISASVPVYYAAKVDTSIPAGSYSNRVTYSAVVDGGITTEATLTSIKVDGQEVDEIRGGKANTILVTTNMMVQPYGTPRVYYRTTNPAGYAECGEVIVSSNEAGYMTIQCTATPSQGATGVTLYIVPKGGENDVFCADGTYPSGSSQCEMGGWKWGEFTVGLPDVSDPDPDLSDIPGSWEEIKYMQHMTSDICAMANIGDAKRLIDVRDGKKYWVGRLVDGNCWMTQNLDLDFVAGKELTSATSNVRRSWDPGTTTFTSDNPFDGDPNDALAVFSWDPGEIVWRKSGNQWQDVSTGWTPLEAIDTDDNPIDASNKNYDAHYLAGNYYTYEAAVAGSGPYYEGTALESICPKGWYLPSSSSRSGGFYSLIGQASLTGSTIIAPPYYFVRGGYYRSTNQYEVGYDGYYWMADAVDEDRADFLTFSTGTIPSAFGGRNTGYSVRCVSPAG